MSSDVTLMIVIVTAVAFDFTNGFHDTANVVAAAISTRAIPPRLAVAFASLLNFGGAFISLKVAATVGQGFVDTAAVTPTVVFAGLVGAITWNLITWYYGLPSSSSHALIGGLVGAVIAAQSTASVDWNGLLGNLIVPVVVAPFVAFASQGAGAAVILAASSAGYPLSTTHVISGGIMGAGAAEQLSAVRWGVAGNIVRAWVLTLPAAAVVGGASFEISRLFGSGAWGPAIIGFAMLVALTATFVRRLQYATPAPATG